MRQWIFYLLFFPVAAAIAAEQHTAEKLTLEQAVINVLEQSPLIKAADYEAKAAAARIRTAQLKPAYRASVELENFAGNDSNSGSKNLESTLSLSRVLELGDKSSLRGELAQNKTLLLRDEQDAKRLDLLAETAKRFIQVVTNQERLVIAEDSFGLAKKTQRVVQRRVKAGKSPNAELRRVRMAMADKQLALRNAKRALETSRLKLSTLWGETQTQFTTAKADLLSTEPIEPFSGLVQLMERNPDLVRFASEKRLAETRIQLAKSARRPDIEITGGIRHFNATDDAGLVLSLNLPLGSRSRATADIEEAEMLALRDPQTYAERRLNLHATLFEVYQEISHAMDAVSTLRDSIIPQARRALRDYEKGYAAGRYSFLELTEAQRQLLDSRLQAVMAASDYHRYRIEIDRLTGVGLSSGENP